MTFTKEQEKTIQKKLYDIMNLVVKLNDQYDDGTSIFMSYYGNNDPGDKIYSLDISVHEGGLTYNGPNGSLSNPTYKLACSIYTKRLICYDKDINELFERDCAKLDEVFETISKIK